MCYGHVMAHALHLEGRRFGDLVVLSWSKDIQRWICRCSCGTEVRACSSDLLKPAGRATHRCRECSAKETRRRLIKDLTGQVFGKLTAVSRVSDRHPILWRCRCECGGEKTVASTYLLVGKTKSCGCMRRANAVRTGAGNRKDYVGMVFGKLTVLGRCPDHPRHLMCRCECGKVKAAHAGTLMAGHAKSCGCLRGGKNHYAYDLSLSDEERGGHHRVAGIDAYRAAVYKRDDYTCRACSQRGGRLVVHHVKAWKWFPKLRLAEQNGITLCTGCHDDFHKKHGRRGPATHYSWKHFFSWLLEMRSSHG